MLGAGTQINQTADHPGVESKIVIVIHLVDWQFSTTGKLNGISR
jgi:hypothetical protein